METQAVPLPVVVVAAENKEAGEPSPNSALATSPAVPAPEPVKKPSRRSGVPRVPITLSKSKNFGSIPDVDDMDARTDELTVLLTLGSDSLKMGLASASAPVCIPTVVAVRVHAPPVRPVIADALMEHQEGNRRGRALATHLKSLKKRRKIMDSGNAFFEQTVTVSVYGRDETKTMLPASPTAMPGVQTWTDVSAKPSKVVGEAALHISPAEPYVLQRPIYRGKLNLPQGPRDPSDEQALGLTTVHNHLTDLLLHGFDELGIPRADTDKVAIAIALPDEWSGREARELMLVLLGGMRVRGVFIHRSSVLSCYGSGRVTACVVDVGGTKSTITSVVEGAIEQESTFTLPVGGNDVDELLLEALKLEDKEHPCPVLDMTLPLAPYARSFMRKVKHQVGRLVQGSTTSLIPVEAVQYKLLSSDAQTVLSYKFNVSSAGVLAPFVLFDAVIRRKKEHVFIGAEQAFPEHDTNLYNPFLIPQSRAEKEAAKEEAALDKARETKNPPLTTAADAPEGGEGKTKAATPAPVTGKKRRVGGRHGRTGKPVGRPRKVAKKNRVFAHMVQVPSSEAYAMTLIEAIIRSIMAVKSVEVQQTLANSILLAGGGTCFEGIRDVVEDKLIEQLPYRCPDVNAVNVITEREMKNVDKRFLSWKGLSILVKGRCTRDQWCTDRKSVV